MPRSPRYRTSWVSTPTHGRKGLSTAEATFVSGRSGQKPAGSRCLVGLSVGTPRRLDEARNEPDRDDHHGAEHKVFHGRLEDAEAEVVDPLQEHVDLEEEVLRRDAERG